MELWLNGPEEGSNDCEDWVSVLVVDAITGVWDTCSELCVESETAVVRCGNGGLSCAWDVFVQEEDVSMVSADLSFVSQSTEDRSKCWNMTTEFVEDNCHQKHSSSGGQEDICQTVCRLGTFGLEACLLRVV